MGSYSERPPVMRDHVDLAEGIVFQDRDCCISISGTKADHLDFCPQ